MKRSFILMSFLLLFVVNICKANEIVIVPTMYDGEAIQNKVWSAAFQLGWNDFTNNVIKNEVRFVRETPASVVQLNRQEFSVKDMSDVEHYQIATKVRPSTKRHIRRDLKKQFDYKSDMLKHTRFIARNDRALIYSMLRKNIEFPQMFDIIGEDVFGKEQKALYYGVTPTTKANFRDNAGVLFYYSPEDFAVVLETKGDDQIFLYRTSENKNFAEQYIEILAKSEKYLGDAKLNEIDELKIPYLKFNEEETFDDISAKFVLASNIRIDKAIETIVFDMTNIGNEQKEDFSKQSMKKALQGEIEPRKLDFNDNFVIFIKNKNFEKPYFAARIDDISLFQQNLEK